MTSILESQTAVYGDGTFTSRPSAGPSSQGLRATTSRMGSTTAGDGQLLRIGVTERVPRPLLSVLGQGMSGAAIIGHALSGASFILRGRI